MTGYEVARSLEGAVRVPLTGVEITLTITQRMRWEPDPKRAARVALCQTYRYPFERREYTTLEPRIPDWLQIAAPRLDRAPYRPRADLLWKPIIRQVHMVAPSGETALWEVPRFSVPDWQCIGDALDEMMQFYNLGDCHLQTFRTGDDIPLHPPGGPRVSNGDIILVTVVQLNFAAMRPWCGPRDSWMPIRFDAQRHARTTWASVYDLEEYSATQTFDTRI